MWGIVYQCIFVLFLSVCFLLFIVIIFLSALKLMLKLLLFFNIVNIDITDKQ